MAIPPDGTFIYVTTIPDHPMSESWLASSPESYQDTGDNMMDLRSAGFKPKISFSFVSKHLVKGPDQPWWHRASLGRIRLEATDGLGSGDGLVSILCDRGILTELKAGDVMYLSKASSADKGISVIREGKLFFAAGAITIVPLGNLKARILDFWVDGRKKIEEIDPLFSMPELPLEITNQSETIIVINHQREIGDYSVDGIRGANFEIEPGYSGCIAISHKDAPRQAVLRTAQILDTFV